MVNHRFTNAVLALPRAVKRGIVVAVDASLCILTAWIAFYLRLNEWVWLSEAGWPAALVALIALPIFSALGLYRAVFRFVDWEGLGAIVRAVAIYGIIYASIFTAFGIEGVPRTIGIIQPVLLLIAISLFRAFGRFWLGGGLANRLGRRHKKNVLIYGAGSAGRQLASAFAGSSEFRIVGFIDDDLDLRGSIVGGVPVWSSEKLAGLVQKLGVSEIFLAIPSASRRRRNEILKQVRALGVAVRTLPSIVDVAQGKVTVTDLRPLEIEDLLGRESVEPDQELLRQCISGKVVLVTGAGGSIGSELCQQIQGIGPVKLLLVDVSEYALYAVHRELERFQNSAPTAGPELIPLLGSVCDENRMRQIIATWRPDTIYHAAAYKHVPLVEHNIIEGVRNNAIGTYTCARLARECEVADFVLISTDKAVRPTNMMGASKRLAEMTLQAFAQEGSKTRFSMVRFGNVLGSSGSVVPLFREQIAAGGPVTVTHRDITRFFMTIPEAAQLVLQAGAMGKGGEVFVLDMDEPVRILKLARRMIELSGLQVRDEQEPDGDIEIVFTGLRPGEKLYEELLIGNNPSATRHPRIMMASEEFLPLSQLEDALAKISAAIRLHDVQAVREQMQYLVKDFAMSTDLVDWVAVQQQEAAGDAPIVLPFERLRTVS